jgi:hypothetical protein
MKISLVLFALIAAVAPRATAFTPLTIHHKAVSNTYLASMPQERDPMVRVSVCASFMCAGLTLYQ